MVDLNYVFLVYNNGRGGAGGALRGLGFLTTGGRGPGCPAWSLVYNNGRGVAGGARLLLQLSVPFSLRPAVLPGPGAALGTGHHGTRAPSISCGTFRVPKATSASEVQGTNSKGQRSLCLVRHSEL